LEMPLSYWDVAVWTGMTAIVLMVTYELMSPLYGGLGLPVDRFRLRVAMVALVLVFFVLLGFRIYQRLILH
jgi:hypothetical protein